MAQPKTKRVLTRAESFTLTCWYKDNIEKLGSLSDAEIITEAEKATGLQSLTEGNIAGTRTALGIPKRPKKQASADVESLAVLLSEQSDKLTRLTTHVQSLLDRVAKLEVA